MGPVFVQGQNPSQQHVSETNLSPVSSQTYFEAMLPLKEGHWPKAKEKKDKQISLTAAASALIASQLTLWPH